MGAHSFSDYLCSACGAGGRRRERRGGLSDSHLYCSPALPGHGLVNCQTLSGREGVSHPGIYILPSPVTALPVFTRPLSTHPYSKEGTGCRLMSFAVELTRLSHSSVQSDWP